MSISSQKVIPWFDADLNTARPISRLNSLNENTVAEPIRSYEYFRNARIKLRGLLLWKSIDSKVKMYGTSINIIERVKSNENALKTLIAMRMKKLSKENIGGEKELKCILHPESNFITKWKFIIALLVLYVFTVTPWVLAFEDLSFSNPFLYVESVVDLLFFIDIILRLNTAYYNKDKKLITSRKKIFLDYLSGLLVIDTIAVIPFYLILDDQVARSSTLIRLVRISRILKIFRVSKITVLMNILVGTKHYYGLLNAHRGLSRLVLGLVLLTLIGHVTSCMWYFIAKLDDLSSTTWVIRHGFGESSKGEVYLAGLYWAFTVMTTLGFGDIHAGNISEMIFCIVWMIFAVGLYSVIAGTVTSIISTFDLKHTTINQKLNDIEIFSKFLNIPKDKVEILKNYIQSTKGTRALSDEFKEKILKEYPVNLQVEIVKSMYNNAPSKLHFFSAKESKFILDIVPKLLHFLLPSTESVYSQFQSTDYIYFLLSGRVSCTLSRDNMTFKEIREGTHFGDVEIVFNTTRRFAVVTNTHCEFLLLDKLGYNRIYDKFPEVFNEIKELAQNRLKEFIHTLLQFKEIIRDTDQDLCNISDIIIEKFTEDLEKVSIRSDENPYEQQRFEHFQTQIHDLHSKLDILLSTLS